MTTHSEDGSSRICLVTTGHPSTNPRLVKEADALVEAGHHVRVVACKFARWADEADAEFTGRPWSIDWVSFGELASPLRRQGLRLRRGLAGRLVTGLDLWPSVAVRAMHYVVPELASAASRDPADLFIAHNLAALPAAARAAAAHGARLGFDAEDFHSGELPDDERDSPTARLTRWAEKRYIPSCDYVTAASEGIAEAYARSLQIPSPTTIHNVFPLSARSVSINQGEKADEKEEGTLSLYWFSQTIGPGRGLEDVLGALPSLDDRVVLSLRGNWIDDFRTSFLARAEEIGVRERIRWLAPTPPGEMVARAGCHDIGLALEQPHTSNRDVCVTNKIFTYILAGLPTIATGTRGQRIVCESMPEATRVVPPGVGAALAEAVTDLSARMPEARRAASRAAETNNWDIDKVRFLEVINGVLGLTTAPRRDLDSGSH